MIRIIVLAGICLASVIPFGCVGREGDPPPAKTSSTAKAQVAPVSGRNSKIPVEVSYPIIDETEEYSPLSKKRLLDVRLNMKVDADVLREIAIELKSQEKRQYERTMIFYYLPETHLGAKREPWATSHFNPTLSVEILGLSKDDEGKLRELPMPEGGELIGSWILDGQRTGRRIAVYREGDAFMMEEAYPGFKPELEALIPLPAAAGHRFKRQSGGDVYEIDMGNVLRLYSGYDGKVIQAAPPLKLDVRG